MNDIEVVHGQPVPSGRLLIRMASTKGFNEAALAKLTSGSGFVAAFELNSADKREQPPQLSVWDNSKTTLQQAWAFTGRRPDKGVALMVTVEIVRESKIKDVALDVVWSQARNDDETPNLRPGHAGHAGILGLDTGGDGKQDKNARLAARSRLADKSIPTLLTEADMAAGEAEWHAWKPEGS